MIPSTTSTSHSRASPYLFQSSQSTTSNSSSQPRAEPLPSSTSSSIRPRNRRLLSTEQELVSTTSGRSSPAGGGSREASPIPRRYPSRSAGASGGTEGEGGWGRNGSPAGGLLVPRRGRDGLRDGGGRGSPSPVGVGGGGWWDGSWSSSWSALQGLANSVLGGDYSEDGGQNGTSRNGTGKRQRKAVSARDLPAAWGPEGLQKSKDQGIGAGNTTDREAKLKTRKMAGVLEGREADESRMLDSNGNYKRRTSLEETRHDSHDDGGDALVYVHHVQPHDTLAGVVLRYNCQPAIFRKANRFWPNDSIQTRKVVVLPVDACAIKGRPCEAPTADRPAVDLLAPTPASEDPPPFQNGVTWPSGASFSLNKTSAERTESEEEQPWVHVRWVSLDSSPNSRPVEIARMPRKTLGYFPPRRRKSQNTVSTVSTPRGSVDFPQFSRSSSQDRTGSPLATPSRRTSNLGHRPTIQAGTGSYFPPPPHTSAGSRSRGGSVGEAAERMGWMRRPGGVGTFGKNVRMPGPANDGLNNWAKKHIPGLAIDGLPSTSILAVESARLGFGGEELGRIVEGPMMGGSGTVTPGYGNAGNGGLGLEHAAAAIEGWVRKLAIKPGTPKLGGRTIVSADGADLIEMLDGAGSDDGRGFELNPGSVRNETLVGRVGGGSGRDDLEAAVRGRGAAAAKAGKSD